MKEGKSLRKWMILGAGILVLVALAVFYRLSFLQKSTTLPDAGDVQSITVRLDRALEFETLAFEVPPDHVPRILAALGPAERDSSPKKWQVLGDLWISRKGNFFVYVSLYRTHEETGAFSVGFPGHRVYYRGGSDKSIEEAIRSAYQVCVKGKKSSKATDEK